MRLGMRKMTKWIVLVGLISMVLSCSSSTKLTSVWQDPNYKSGVIKSVMVIGLHPDQEKRIALEKNFSDEFNQNGVKSFESHGMVSLPVVPENKEITQEQRQAFARVVKEAAQKSNAQAVLMTYVLSIERWEEAWNANPMDMTTDLYTAYYYQLYNPSGAGAKPAVNTQIRLQTRIYDVATEKMIWKGSSESVNPTSLNALLKGLSKTVIEKLRQDKLI